MDARVWRAGGKPAKIGPVAASAPPGATAPASVSGQLRRRHWRPGSSGRDGGGAAARAFVAAARAFVAAPLPTPRLVAEGRSAQTPRTPPPARPTPTIPAPHGRLRVWRPLPATDSRRLPSGGLSPPLFARVWAWMDIPASGSSATSCSVWLVVRASTRLTEPTALCDTPLGV